MRYTNQSQYLLGDTTPATFGRIARTISVAGLATTSANEPDIRDPLTPLALRSLVTRGFREAANDPRDLAAALSTVSLHTAARTQRSRAIGDLIVSVARAGLRSARRLAAHLRRQHEQRLTYRALAALDARTLNDIGVSHGEIRAIAYATTRIEERAHRGA